MQQKKIKIKKGGLFFLHGRESKEQGARDRGYKGWMFWRAIGIGIAVAVAVAIVVVVVGCLCLCRRGDGIAVGCWRGYRHMHRLRHRLTVL
jgi:hypothetical protein